ncbi:uncharacterized protein KZ484_021380 isoform 1-T1 [Pholidichthys leucotaenia]
MIYYCAIVSCGHIVFGNGTKLYYQGKTSSLVLVCSLGGALTFTTILCMLLGFLLHKTKNKNNCNSTGTAEFPAHSTNIQDFQEVDSPHFAALNIHQRNRSRTQQNNTPSECVYSRINS